MEPKRETLKGKAIRELKEFFFISFYLWVFLAMFVEFKSIVLAGQHIDFVAHGVAIINALLLGKFMLVARAFHPGRRAEAAPLIYPTLLKAAILAVVLAMCKILEDFLVGRFHKKSFAESIADFGGGSAKTIFIFTVMLFVVLLPLTAFGELGRVVGEKKLHALFLRPRDASTASGHPML